MFHIFFSRMAVSVPPPLYHLNNVVKYRDDSPTLTATTTAMTSSSPLKPKNKRKSLEPKKLSTTSPHNNDDDDDHSTTAFTSKRLKVESDCRLDGSDGEPTHSPSSSSTSGCSTSSSDGLSPQTMLAPKKRFKQEALKYLEESKQQSEKSASNPFRPWDDGATSPTVKPSFPEHHPAFLYNPLQSFFPTAGFFPSLLTAHPQLTITPKIEPPTTSPAVASILIKRDIEPRRATPPFYPSLLAQAPKHAPQRRSPKVEPVSRPVSPSPSPAQSTTDFSSLIMKRESSSSSPPQFDAETCQVLSRLYPFLLNRSAAPPSEPEQEEPLALVKRKVDEDDDVFVKQEQEDDSGNDSLSTATSGGKAKQRNYKNMTRERRIEANARERQRVHTITAAFDRLQGAIPTAEDAPGAANKLSKLSVIKIATSYIMVLSRMAGHDYSKDQTAPSIEECIRQCADLVKAEAKTRKKSSESSD